MSGSTTITQQQIYNDILDEFKGSIIKLKTLFRCKTMLSEIQLNLRCEYVQNTFNNLLNTEFYKCYQPKLAYTSESLKEFLSDFQSKYKEKHIAHWRQCRKYYMSNNENKALSALNIKYEDISYDTLEKQIIKPPRESQHPDLPKPSYQVKNGKIIGSDGSTFPLIL